MKHITALRGEDVEFYVKAVGTSYFKGIVMGMRFGSEGCNHGFALSKQMEMVSQARA
jgi:hypothetical protein